MPLTNPNRPLENLLDFELHKEDSGKWKLTFCHYRQFHMMLCLGCGEHILMSNFDLQRLKRPVCDGFYCLRCLDRKEAICRAQRMN